MITNFIVALMKCSLREMTEVAEIPRVLEPRSDFNVILMLPNISVFVNICTLVSEVASLVLKYIIFH